MKKLLLIVSVSFLMNNSLASDMKGLVKLSADFGGEKLITVPFTDGSTADVEAGQGLLIGGGGEVNVLPNMLIKATAAFKYTSAGLANNGSVTWTRVPIDIIALYRLDKLKVGGGISYSLNNSLKGSGVASGVDSDFDNALGYTAILEYAISEKYSASVQYTLMEFKESVSGTTVDGNNFGIGFNWYFMP